MTRELTKLFGKHFKEILEFGCALVYGLIGLFILNKPCRIVICYHRVKKREIPAFRKQMEYLAINCTVVKPSSVQTARANGTNHVVAIIFDDAFVSVMENAVPVLKEYQLPAGIAVPTGNQGQLPCWEIHENCSDKDETVMSQEQIAELDNAGFEIFSHTVSHPVLTKIEDRKLKTELIDSKLGLERIVGHEVSGLIYPYGACDARVYEMAQKAGYKMGFTIEPCMVDRTTDKMQIGRFDVSPRDCIFKFKLKVIGAYQVKKYLQWLKRQLLRCQ